jgi:hypothetical protein
VRRDEVHGKGVGREKIEEDQEYQEDKERRGMKEEQTRKRK